MELPYKRRLQKQNLQLDQHVQIERRSHMKPAASALVSLISRSLITFLASLAGAVLASFASIYFTLTTLEAFKAEESLRQFAIADLYRPLREKASECLTIRSNALGALSAYSGILKGINGYANEYIKNESLRSLDATGAEGLIKPLMDQLSSYAQKAMEGQTAANTCDHTTNNMATEAATVLGLNKEYEVLYRQQITRFPKAVNMFRDDDILLSIISNPSGTIAIGLAIKDGMDGEKTRMISAFAKLKSSLEKSVKQSEAALAYEREMTTLAYKHDSERARLFLSNLKRRFELTPKSTLSQAFDEAASLIWMREQK